jgi:hypothetical protein
MQIYNQGLYLRLLLSGKKAGPESQSSTSLSRDSLNLSWRLLAGEFRTAYYVATRLSLQG